MGLRDVEQRVDRNTGEGHTELGPGGDAMDVTVVGGLWQFVNLWPTPRRRARHQTLHSEGPIAGVKSGSGFGGQARPAATGVVLAGRQTRVAVLAADEAAGESGHSSSPLVRRCCNC